MKVSFEKEGKTSNIYNSWEDTAGLIVKKGKINTLILKQLSDFSLTELNHLKWLIEEQIIVIEIGAVMGGYYTLEESLRKETT